MEDRDPIFERGSTTTYSSFRKPTYSKPWSSQGLSESTATHTVAMVMENPEKVWGFKTWSFSRLDKAVVINTMLKGLEIWTFVKILRLTNVNTE